MIPELLRDVKFFLFLLAIDRDILERARLGMCPFCGAPLHRSDFPRNPRGGPEVPGVDWKLRYSLCCSREGCRKRLTPPSVRFLGRKVYLGAVVVLVTAMMHGATPSRLERLSEWLDASPRTLERWRKWWRTVFAKSPFWKAARGRFDTPVDEALLPGSLLDRFRGALRSRAISVLKFLSPITTTSAPESMAF